MKERPILFSGAMVRALLAGTKTQTRRVVKPQPEAMHDGEPYWFIGGYRAWTYRPAPPIPLRAGGAPVLCPYGQPGDRLWVRETFARIDGQTRPWIETDYKATYTHGDRLGDSLGIRKKWSPSIHMPRDASRITLEITGLRMERLQDISEADAIAEGVYTDPACPAYDAYAQLWDEINGSGSWAKNPWVWVIDFRRIEAKGGAA